MKNQKNNLKVKTIFGGPGTGKTTSLLKIIENLLKSGVSIDRIAFVSFSKKAKREALTRSLSQLGYSEDELVHFKTLHATAHHMLMLEKDQTLTSLKDFTEQTKYRLSNLKHFQETDSKNTLSLLSDDSLFELFNKQIKDQLNDKELLQSHSETIQRDFLIFKDKFLDYCAKAGVYTQDMKIETALKRNLFPLVDYIFVDEAQDCSPLQWAYIIAWAERNEIQLFLAGDDDQAIFGFAGSDVNKFLQIAELGEKEILPITYRLPKSHLEFANSIISNVKIRQPKHIISTKDEGDIWIVDPEYVTALIRSKLKESWTIQARNKYILEAFIDKFFRKEGIAYSFQTKEEKMSVNKTNEALFYWQVKNTENDSYSIQGLIDFVPQKGFFSKGVKTVLSKRIENLKAQYPTVDSFEFSVTKDELRGIEKDQMAGIFTLLVSDLKINQDNLVFYEDLYRNMGKDGFLSTPKINFSTIHSNKGGEAENVVLLADISPSSYQAFRSDIQSDREESYRTLYVGCTRALKNLFICKRPFLTRDSLTDFLPNLAYYRYI